METASVIEFSLTSPGLTSRVDVRLRRLGPRWVAEVACPEPSTGLGNSARLALAAALQPLGDLAMRALMADLGLLEPSVAVLAIEASERSA